VNKTQKSWIYNYTCVRHIWAWFEVFLKEQAKKKKKKKPLQHLATSRVEKFYKRKYYYSHHPTAWFACAVFRDNLSLVIALTAPWHVNPTIKILFTMRLVVKILMIVIEILSGFPLWNKDSLQTTYSHDSITHKAREIAYFVNITARSLKCLWKWSLTRIRVSFM